MPTFYFDVLETSMQLVRYTVEAGDETAARDLARDGETDEETPIFDCDVIDREIDMRVSGPVGRTSRA